jgi:hypothetical protein
MSGPGKLSASERKHKAKEIIAASGADTAEHFEKVVRSNHGITFREQAEISLGQMMNRKRKPLTLNMPPLPVEAFPFVWTVPGVSKISVWKLRPLSGKFSAKFRSMVVLTVASVVLMTGPPALTVTVSDTELSSN